MDANQVLNELNGIFRDEFDNKKINISFTTVANDIEEWDSLSHVQLIVAIEKHFKLRFTTSEINNWKNVGEMCTAIETRLKNK